MPKLVTNTPTKLEKIKPKPGFQRRNSTGNADIIFSEPKPIPNYLRASIGSCHDLCKHGSRHDVKPEARSITNFRGKNVSGAKSLVPLSSRKQPSDLKPKPLVRSLQSSLKQPISKSKSLNEAGKGTRMLNASKNTSSSAKIPTAKIRKSKSSMEMISHSKIKKSVEAERSICGDVPENIIHVVKPNTNGDDQNVDLTNDQDGNRCNETCSSPKQLQQKTDSAEKSWNTAVKVERVVMKENGASLRQQKMKREKALGIENGPGSMSKGLRRVASDGHSINDDEEDESMRVALRHQVTGGDNTSPDSFSTVIEAAASRLAWMSKSKVKALVDTFETLVNVQDSDIRVYSRSA